MGQDSVRHTVRCSIRYDQYDAAVRMVADTKARGRCLRGTGAMRVPDTGEEPLFQRIAAAGRGRVRGSAALLAAGCVLLAALVLRDHEGPGAFPPVTISTIDGRSFDATTIEGRPLLVTFWSTTCLVCLREMPELEALYHRFSRRGFELIAVAMPWDPPDAVVRLARARALPYPVALDVDGAIARAFGDVPVTPTHVLIDPAGDVAFRRTGALDFSGLDERLQSML